MKMLTEDEYRDMSNAMEERDRLLAFINTPKIDDFLKAVQAEEAHQRYRWGEAHDRDKSAENWFFLVGYLSGKALRAAVTGDKEKALHHCVSSAACLFQWFKAIKADTTGAGVGVDADLDPEKPASPVCTCLTNQLGPDYCEVHAS